MLPRYRASALNILDCAGTSREILDPESFFEVLMPPFWAEYLCPRQSPFWQRGRVAISSLQAAILFAQSLKPGSPNGHCRVIDSRGIQVYFL